MLGKKRHSGESLIANVTVVLLDVTVRLQVRAQVGPISEGAPTELAREWLLSCVCANMSLKKPRSRESLATNTAFTGKSVCTYVHLESTQGRVLLSTLLAAKLFLDLNGTVELCVLVKTAVS